MCTEKIKIGRYNPKKVKEALHDKLLQVWYIHLNKAQISNLDLQLLFAHCLCGF